MNGTIIGYYPTSLFTTDNREPARPLLPDVSKTLAHHGTSVGFGGQVYGSSSGAMTTTDMGSGKFPEEGYKRSAFIGMMKYQDKPNGDKQCSNCGQFTPLNGCKVVDGTISPQGYCIVWVKK